MSSADVEKWNPVPGFGNHYEASSLGRVRVKDRTVFKRHSCGKISKQHYSGRMLSLTKGDKLGHLNVRFGVDGFKFTRPAHYMVLLAFVGPRPSGMEACHNNGNAADNRPENLRWDTHANNNRDRKQHGKYATGMRHPMAKFPNELCEKIRRGELTSAAAKKLCGISLTHFYRIKNGESRAEV